VLLPRYSLANNAKKYTDEYCVNGEPIVIETNDEDVSREDPMLSDNENPRSGSNFSNLTNL